MFILPNIYFTEFYSNEIKAKKKEWQTDGGGRSYCMESTAVRLPQEDVISPVWHSLCDQHQVNDPPKTIK